MLEDVGNMVSVLVVLDEVLVEEVPEVFEEVVLVFEVL